MSWRCAGSACLELPAGPPTTDFGRLRATVTVPAERADVPKQAMAELVAHLETHGCVTREPNPADRRADVGHSDSGHVCRVSHRRVEREPVIVRGRASAL